MRKLVVTTLMLLTGGAIHALPVGNPTEASLFIDGVWCRPSCNNLFDPCSRWCDVWSFRLGFYGDYVFNRNMEVDTENNHRDINVYEINTNAGYLVLNICNRIDIFGVLGATQMSFEANDKATGQSIGIGTEVHFQTDFSWSVGARATLWECGCLGVGIEGQYFQTSPDLDYLVFYNSGLLRYFNEGDNVCYREWQTGIGVSYRFAIDCPRLAMIPYVALKWAGSKLKTDDPLILGTLNQRIPDLESKKLWGWAIGTTLMLCDRGGMTVEGRFADEKAVYVNGQIRF